MILYLIVERNLSWSLIEVAGLNLRHELRGSSSQRVIPFLSHDTSSSVASCHYELLPRSLFNTRILVPVLSTKLKKKKINIPYFKLPYLWIKDFLGFNTANAVTITYIKARISLRSVPCTTSWTNLNEDGSFQTGMLPTRALNVSNRLALQMQVLIKKSVDFFLNTF